MKLLILFISLSFAFFNLGCSGFESTVSNVSEGLQQGSTQSTGNLGVLSSSINANLKLGETQVHRMQFNSGTYSGNVSFQIDRSSLSGITGQEDVGITITPAQLQVSTGETVTLIIEIASQYRAPSFSGQSVSIVASGDNGLQSTISFPLAVTPELEIQMNQCDYQNNATLDECWNVPGSIDLRAHSGNVTVRFTNCDPTSGHIVHGNGAIQHQPVNQPLPQAVSSTNCQGAYTLTFNGNQNDSGTYYMHDTQGGGQSRRINFAVANPMAAAAASLADDFDRGPSNTGSCHDPVGEE